MTMGAYHYVVCTTSNHNMQGRQSPEVATSGNRISDSRERERERYKGRRGAKVGEQASPQSLRVQGWNYVLGPMYAGDGSRQDERVFVWGTRMYVGSVV